MRLNAEQQGILVFDIMEQNVHRPFQNGQANQDHIDEYLTIGLYKGVIPPMDQEDADMIVSMVNELINVYGRKPS